MKSPETLCRILEAEASLFKAEAASKLRQFRKAFGIELPFPRS